MPRISQIGVQYRGGFRGSYIDIAQLIDRRVKIDIIDFVRGESCVRNCESYCRMQIKINGKLCVTWHSSENLTSFLEDCKRHTEETGEVTFPLEECIITVGDDKAYYLQDAPEDAYVPCEKELEKMFDKSRRKR